MREYIWSHAYKRALSGHLSMSVKLYPEEAKALVQDGFEVDPAGGNRYTVSWANSLNDASGEEVSKYIYGESDEFPKCVTKPNQKLCVLALRTLRNDTV